MIKLVGCPRVLDDAMGLGGCPEEGKTELNASIVRGKEHLWKTVLEEST